MSSRQQLIKAGRGSLVLRVISFAAALVSSIVLARAMGPSGYGIYAHAFAIISLLLIPSQLGVPILLLRETARADTADQVSTLKGLWAWSTRVIMGSAVIIAVLTGLVIWAAGDRISRSLAVTLCIGLPLLPLMSLGDARAAALRGLRFIVLGQVPEAIIRPVLLPALVGVVWLIYGHVSATSGMALNVVVATTSLVIVSAFLWHVKPAALSQVSADYSLTGFWRRAAMSLALISSLQLLNQQVGIVLLGLFRPDAEVGIFRVALSASTLALFGTQTISMVSSPYMARLYAAGDQNGLRKLVGICTSVSFTVALPIALVFLFGGRALVHMLYGANYVHAWQPLMILVVGQVIGVAFGPAAQLLNMSGHERSALLWLVTATAANIVAGLALIPTYGMDGAAWATTLTTAIVSAASWHVVRRRVNISGGLLASGRIMLSEVSAGSKRL